MKKLIKLTSILLILLTLISSYAFASEEALNVVYGEQIKDGTYAITVESDSKMFKVENAELTAKDGVLTAVITLSGTGYTQLYAGTGEDALEDTPSTHIQFTENTQGQYSFEVPVSVLDSPLSFAAWSEKKSQWYDRQLTFLSEGIPADAINALVVPADGEYEVAVTLSGGSGRAKVESPAVITVKEGKITAKVVWGSSNYDFMIVNGVKYDPVQTEGNSTFEIPVVLDVNMPVSAQTVAMSSPHLVDYILHFDSSTIPSEKDGFPMGMVLGIVAAAAVAGIVIASKKKGAKA